MLVKAYQYGTFSKIQEFIEFRRRLDTSLQQAISRTELMRLDYIHTSFQTKYAVQFFQEQDVSNIPFDDEFIAARSDNRDFKVFINCNAEDSLAAESICKPACSTNAAWVQVLSYILNILSIVCETKESGRDLTTIASDFKKILDQENIQITPTELALARYVSELTNALVSIKASKLDIATTDLNKATTILEVQCRFFFFFGVFKPTNFFLQVSKVDTFSEKTLAWSTFHKLSTALEV